MRYFKILIAVAALLAATGCNSHPGTNLSDPTSQISGIASSDESLSSDAVEWIAEDADDFANWQKVLDNPGVAGVDYDPNWILVNYFSEATPSEEMNTAPAPGLRAADGPNAILRTNGGFETITDAIASKFGLKIGSQVYYGRLNYACFGIPEGTDGFTLILDIRREFGAVAQYVTFDRKITACYDANDPFFVSSSATAGHQWPLKKCRFDEAWDYTRGDPNVRIAIVDTGCRITHEELTSQVLDPQVHFPGEQLDIANRDNTMEDSQGHGTFLCGLVGAEGDNNRTLVGAAPNCEVIPVKMSEDGSANHGSFAEGCLLGFTLGAKAINLSWRSTGGSPVLRDMVNEIWDGGAILFVSAANDNSTAKTYPASYNNAVAVGNSKNDDSRAPTSTYGDWVDIVAPGHNPTSTGNHQDDDYHEFWGSGTSYSAPITAAAAALLWSYDPTLTNVQVRELLETTGPLSTGFNVSPDVEIRRLDVAAAFEAIEPFEITAPQQDRLFYSGTVVFEPVVAGDADRVDLWLDDVFAGSLMQEPWFFPINTGGTEIGPMILRFIAVRGLTEVEDTIVINVDNSVGRSTFSENFELPELGMYGGDLKNHTQNFLGEIKSIATGWTTDDIFGAGPAIWGIGNNNPQEGLSCASLSTVGETYGDFEIDAISTRRLDLTGVTDPTLVFFQRYNIKQSGTPGDIARVLVTTDGGQTFVPVVVNGGGNAEFSGYQDVWQKVEVDLSPYTSQPIHLVFVFESDSAGAGEQAGEPASWHIDNITIATNYAESIPLVDGIVLSPGSLLGNQLAENSLSFATQGAQNVAEVQYTLDCIPIGESGGNDLELLVSSGGDFAGFFDLHAVPVVNQMAILRVTFVDAVGTAGSGFSLPVTIFNFLGDVNSDGLVDGADTAAYGPMIGLTSDDPGYIAFFDSNLDGTITELDAAAVGYYWGSAGQ